MGFALHEAEAALRLSRNDPTRALQMLRSGGGAARAAARAEARGSLGYGDGRGEAVHVLEAQLRALPAFHSLGQVVRVDPQIMLVLNTDAMRFEDQRGGQHHCEASQEREALETAFWEACAQELDASPPVFERTLQLLHEMSDTLCSLMLPAHGAAGERGGGAGGSSGCGALGADSDAALEALRWEEAQRQARSLAITPSYLPA